MQLEMVALKADHRKYLIAEMQYNYPVLHNLQVFLLFGFWIINERYFDAHNDYGIRSKFSWDPKRRLFQFDVWTIDVQGGSWILFKDGKHYGVVGWSSDDSWGVPNMLREAEAKIENETA